MYALCLDSQGRLLNCKTLAQGTVNDVKVSFRKIMDRVVSCNAVAVILAHNHPNGNAMPSQDDIDFTKEISYWLSNAGIKLIDHVIFGETDHCCLLSALA